MIELNAMNILSSVIYDMAKGPNQYSEPYSTIASPSITLDSSATPFVKGCI